MKSRRLPLLLFLALLFLCLRFVLVAPRHRMQQKELKQTEEAKNDSPPPVSSLVEEDEFTVLGEAVQASAEMLAQGQAIAAELEGGIPVLNASFTAMSLQEFMQAMMRHGVAFVVGNSTTGEFAQITSLVPFRCARVDIPDLARINERYSRIAPGAPQTEVILAAWGEQEGTQGERGELLMFVPRSFEYAVLGALASTGPPAAEVASYRGYYRRISDRSVQLEIIEAVTKSGVKTAIGEVVAF